jgi:hypothetical protein
MRPSAGHPALVAAGRLTGVAASAGMSSSRNSTTTTFGPLAQSGLACRAPMTMTMSERKWKVAIRSRPQVSVGR